MNKTCMRENKLNFFWFVVGFVAVLAMVVPYLILGTDAIFTYHDQLDGELIAYLLQAKRLFQGDILPEFMGGASKTELIPPAPLCVLLFLPGNGYAALLSMLLLEKIFGYLGMYLLCRETVRESWIGAVTGVLYISFPFLTVYGLSQFGIPLLFWSVLQLKKGKHIALAYCCVAFYTLCSSLVLVGFGLLGMGCVLFLWKIWRKRHIILAWFLMLTLYVTENFHIFRQLLGSDIISHRAEYVLADVPFADTFVQMLFRGDEHNRGSYVWLLAGTLLAAIVWFVIGRREEGGKRGADGRLRIIAFCLGWNIFFAAVASLWRIPLFIWIRGFLTAVGSFQIGRLIWIAPCLWYLAGAAGMALVWELLKRKKGIGIWWCAIVLGVAVGITGIQNLLSNDIRFNIQKLRNPDYKMISFRDYYALGVLDQVQDFLRQETGAEPEDYRVVSLGIDPAAALYNGFYCLDGYSSSYSLEYKHAFREILEPELERSDYLRAYFDDWGNRCYLFSSEIPGYYTIKKNSFYFQDYQLNTTALYRLGGQYVLSAAYIVNADQAGLTLMREEPFETEDSYYRIFVYKVSVF